MMEETGVPNQLVSVRETHGGAVRELILGGSKGNIVTEALVAELRARIGEATDGAGAGRGLKLLVIRGDGPHFSYGASVEEHLPGAVERMLPAFHALIGEMLHCDVPTLARVSGLCLGGGFEVALACAMIWCDDTAKFGVPEITLGVFPPVASALLPAKTADAVAADMILTGRPVSAAEAHRTGIVNTVVPAGTLDTALDDFIKMAILPRSASSLRFACAAARMRLRRRYTDDIAALESLYLGKLMSTHDAAEGIRAFLAKRTPEWKDA